MTATFSNAATPELVSRRRSARAAFTLVEMLMATAATLLLMAFVVQIFARVGDTVSNTRSTIQTVDRLRAARQTLQADLAGRTCPGPLSPPLAPKDGSGYFEIIEGPIGSRFYSSAAPMLIAEGAGLSVFNPQYAVATPGDTTLGDIDDVLMFTTTTDGPPFTGRMTVAYPTATGGVNTTVSSTTSDTAEVCWFLRGNTLYRRMLLVKPSAQVFTAPGFYANNDLSVRQEGGTYSLNPDPYAAIGAGVPKAVRLVPNSLGDLTNRQNRYGHQPFAFPYDARFWGPLGLPTLRDCTYYTQVGGVTQFVWPFPLFDSGNPAINWIWGQTLLGPNGPILYPAPASAAAPYSVMPPSGTVPAFPQIPQVYVTVQGGNALGAGQFDMWANNAVPVGPSPWDQTDQVTGTLYYFSAYNSPTLPPGNARVAEDVVLRNVLSFDVRVWDPDAPVVGHPGLDGLPGIAGVDDDRNGVTDDFTELGAAASDDIVLAPGDIYIPPTGTALPAGFPPANAYNYAGAGAITNANNWVNTQYLAILTVASTNLTPLPTLPQIIRKGAYVDLCYGQNPGVPATFAHPRTILSGPGDFRSQLWAGGAVGGNFFVMPAVYDTGSFTYENDGLNQDAITTAFQNALLGLPPSTMSDYGPDQGTNYVDDNGVMGRDDSVGEPYVDVNGNGLFDDGPTNYTPLNLNGIYDPPETEAPPPYRTTLHGIQVKIRVFDPNSRQIREITVVQEFENE